MKTFAERVIAFNENLHFSGNLPQGIHIMNPFQDEAEAARISSEFYLKYYNDYNKRYVILGINPGRFGAGLTGVPFTDTKRLVSECKIGFDGKITHEPSATFIYGMIHAFGGLEKFYGKFYIHSVCPLGFTKTNALGKQVNYNYYDTRELTEAVYDFIIAGLQEQISLGIETDLCFCFGTGKNETFLKKINEKYGFFKEIIALEHPRYIMQYKSKTKDVYISKYLDAFSRAR